MLAAIIILTIAGVCPQRKRRLSQLSSQLVVHLRSAGADRALSSASVESENRTSKQGSFLVRPASQ
jgi:hypothetical protein